MPLLQSDKRIRFKDQYGLNDYDTEILTNNRELSEYIEDVINKTEINPKSAANSIITEVLALANKSNIGVKNYPVTPSNLRTLLLNVHEDIISSKQAKDVFERMWNNGENAQDIIEKEGMKQISNTDQLNKVVDNIINNNYKSVEEYLNGKDKLLGFFVGQVKKETQGKGNPKIINKLLKEKLKS